MSADPLDLRLLRYFIETANHLSFTAGAQACGITQSALSQAIRQLEGRLGVPLFDRGDRRVTLTAAGKELLGRARRLLVEATETENALAAFSGGSLGTLRVGVVQTVGALIVPRALARFGAQHPEAKVDIRELAAGQIEEAISEGLLEVGISFHPASRPSLLIEPLEEERLLYLSAPSRRGTKIGSVHPNLLVSQPLALLHKEFCTRQLIDKTFAKAGLTLEPRVEMNSIAGLLALVSQTTFGTILPEQALRMSSPKPLTAFVIENIPLRRRLIILRRRNSYRSPLAESFLSAIREEFRKN